MRRSEVKSKTRVKICSKSKLSVRVKNRNAMAVEKPPFWVNPCGQSIGIPEDQEEISRSDVISNIIEVTSNAQAKLDDIKTRYFKAIFDNETYQESKFNDVKFEWLPDIEKSLGDDVTQDHLQNIDFQTALQNTYVNLQTVAAGMECVLKNSKFRRLKADIIGHIKLILCELYEGMILSKTNLPQDVSRNVVPKDFQEVDRTTGVVRDWIVFRELLNNIEYILQVFTHLQNDS